MEGQEVAYGNGIIDRETDHLPVTVCGRTTIFSLDITDTAHHELILGLPWLKAKNPRIDWVTGQIYWDNAVPQKRTAINGEGRSSVTEDSPRRRRSNEPTHTSKKGRDIPFKRMEKDLATLRISPRDGSRSGQDRIGQRLPRSPPITHEQRFLLYLATSAAETGTKSRLENIPDEYRQFAQVFQETLDTGIPEHTQYDHEIPLKEGTTPRFHKIYGLNEEQLKALREYLDENLQKGYIRPSRSPAGYPILFVPKKNGKLRLCVDYRQLNDITIKNRYPLPLIKELRDRLQGAQWFTALDLKGAYNLIRMKAGKEWKTAFRTRYGHYEYTVMPFGLTNAPASFQEMINQVLREYLDIFVIAYLDDILIFSPTLELHKQHVTQILQKLQDAKLLVEPEKSFFHVQQVDYLGYTIAPGQIRMQKDKVEAISKWPTPQNVKDVRAFIGYVNFYRQYIRNYSGVGLALTELTKKDKPFEWTTQAQEAFDKLKEHFAKEPILQEADPTKPFEMETDASDFALGGQLGQRDNQGRLRLISNFSQKLNGPELNYPIHDKELMAIIRACEEWKQYLIGAKHPITVYTDHKNLVQFTTTKVLNKRQTRWAEFLSQFDLKIIYQKGTENGRADALSRRSDHEQTEEPQGQTIFTQDPQGNLVHEKREIDATSRIEPNKRNPSQMTLEEQDKFIREIHSAPAHGHQGNMATYHRVKRIWNPPHLKRRIEAIIKDCNNCRKNKTERHKPYGLLKPLQVPSAAWESISLDFIVKLPRSREPLTGTVFDSILVVVCRLTKYAHFIPYKEASTAEELAYIFLRNILSNHGMPEEIISDRDKLFISKFWRSLTAQLGSKQKMSTSYHPQTDGQTERINQIVEQYLRFYLNYQQDNWVELLPLAQFAYNSARTSTTEKSPFFANYGYEPQAYHEQLAGPEAPKATKTAHDIKTIQREIQQQLLFIQDRMAKYANRKRIEGPILEEGDKVYLLRRNIKTKRPSDKLDHKKIGPFKISRKLSNINYELSLPQGMRIHPIFHISLLEPAPQNAQIETQIQLEEHPEEYEVEQILDSRQHGNQTEYLIRWKNYGPQDDTWEPLRNLTNCSEKLDQYQQTQTQPPQRDREGNQTSRPRRSPRQRSSNRNHQN